MGKGGTTEGFVDWEEAKETLKMVIAVIAISFLVYFLISLYMTNKASKNLELAKATLEHLVDEINVGSGEVEIYNPEGWVIISWPYDGKRPNSCSNLGWDDCICICKDVNFGQQLLSVLPFIDSLDQFSKKCDDKGICLENTQKLIVRKEGVRQQPILIEHPPLKLNIDQEGKSIK